MIRGTNVNTKLIWLTPEAENTIAYCARVSNPSNQDNKEIAKLLSYCMKHGHWSVFEMASMCVEITTSRAISAQILRHRSFSFQEFSQRYAENTEVLVTTPRRQDLKNRQNSIDDLDDDTLMWWDCVENDIQAYALKKYKEALNLGIAKECARMLLPMSTQTRLYMSGTIRSWLHYIKVRTHESTQLEHREIALEIKEMVVNELPIIGALL